MYRARNLKNRKNCITLFEGKEGLEFIVFDTETTGKDADNSFIVQLSAIKCRISNHTAVTVEQMDVYIKPPVPMKQKIIDIHGITNEFLEEKPVEKEVFGLVYAFFGEKPVVVGHNVSFDTGMLTAMYERNGKAFRPVVELDTLEMARDLVHGKEVTNYRLGTLMEIYGLDAGFSFHSASDDTKATLLLLNVFYEEYKKLPPVCEKHPVYVNRIYYWKGYNKNQMGIYLDTSEGKMFYSTNNKAWFSSEIKLDEIDIDKMEKELLKKMELPSMKEFGRLTEKKFMELKQSLRKKNIYL